MEVPGAHIPRGQGKPVKDSPRHIRLPGWQTGEQMWSLGGEPRGGDGDVELKCDSEGSCSWSWLRKWAGEEAQGGKAGHAYLLSSSYIPPTPRRAGEGPGFSACDCLSQGKPLAPEDPNQSDSSGYKRQGPLVSLRGECRN